MNRKEGSEFMKKGVSLTTVIIAVSIMIILISSVSVIGSSAISSANFEEYKSSIERVSDEVNIYSIENKILPVTSEVVSADSLGNGLLSALNDNNDLSNKLHVVDIGKLNDYTFKKGRGTLQDKDVFVVAENTNNVYYLKGFKYKGKVYFNY